jgi:NAD(P)-dependent dehydrogenase (short-subunit alcohol dehydrogenase family)
LISIHTGICLCFADLLLRNGCNVLIADVALRPEAEALVAKYVSSKSPRVEYLKTDVANWDQLENMFTVADKMFGGVDIVCPGAGIFEPVGVLLHLSTLSLKPCFSSLGPHFGFQRRAEIIMPPLDTFAMILIYRTRYVLLSLPSSTL